MRVIPRDNTNHDDDYENPSLHNHHSIRNTPTTPIVRNKRRPPRRGSNGTLAETFDNIHWKISGAEYISGLRRSSLMGSTAGDAFIGGNTSSRVNNHTNRSVLNNDASWNAKLLISGHALLEARDSSGLLDKGMLSLDSGNGAIKKMTSTSNEATDVLRGTSKSLQVMSVGVNKATDTLASSVSNHMHAYNNNFMDDICIK